MLDLAEQVKTRIAALPEFSGWKVFSPADAGERKGAKRVDVRCGGAEVADSKSGAVNIAPGVSVTIVEHRDSVGAADSLDGGFYAAVSALHNWRPETVRNWSPLSLRQVTEPMFADEGYLAYELVFSSGVAVKGVVYPSGSPF